MTESFLHGTSVFYKNAGIFIQGKSGTGKSSLALQLIDHGALLISDDQTFITPQDDHLILSPPEQLKGLLEVRGIGICPFPYKEGIPLTLCIEICQEEECERLPTPSQIEYHGIQVPILKLEKQDALKRIKIDLKLQLLGK